MTTFILEWIAGTLLKKLFVEITQIDYDKLVILWTYRILAFLVLGDYCKKAEIFVNVHKYSNWFDLMDKMV
ncbi:hypothetical protein D5F52_08705 [Brevibacillus laterosporus]|nr:hypothetical protein D5F52_08705 [Brevibacillus laterosporus]